MPTLITDPGLEERLREVRKATGADRYDEVWEGVYHMPPMPNDEHQQIVLEMGYALHSTVGIPRLGQVRAGINVSDREEGWEHNYRVPDIAVFLHGGRARNRDTFWLGGPDFVAEIISPGDDTRDKLPFYAQIGTREVLLIDRDPWALELYQLKRNRLRLVGQCSLAQPAVLASAVLPLTFALLPGRPRPFIEVAHTDGEQRWTV